MDNEFPFVEVSANDHEIVGPSDPGTRMHRAMGPQSQMVVWFDYINERYGPHVSPGGVVMFAPVTRASVYKRLKEGKLTAFVFEITDDEDFVSIFGMKMKLREAPLVYVPVSECKAWGEELRLRAAKIAVMRDAKEVIEDLNEDFLKRKKSAGKKR